MLGEVEEYVLRKVCEKYDADSSKANILDSIIVVPVDSKDLYIVLDHDFHILGIDKYKEDDNKSFDKFFDNKYNSNVTNGDNNFCIDLESDSFDNYSLSMIQSISDKTYLSDSGYCFFKSKIIRDEYLIELLSYFYFLSSVIKSYSHVNLGIQKLGYDVPDIPTYLKSVTDELNLYIEKCIQDNKKPSSEEFLRSLGYGDLYINNNSLENVFNYVLREKGYKIDSDNKTFINVEDNDFDISDTCMKLVKLIDKK